MSVEPVDPRVRLAIAQWPDDAPRGAVSAFCVEYGISRHTFYKLRRRAEQLGQAAVLEPFSRRPHTSPTALSEHVKDQALAVRASLASSGLDHGPISVHDKMRSMGLPAPSVASLARIFRAEGVARAEPRKRPRSAWRRFVYPAPNACWQLDATEYVLHGGRTCVIFQLIDDHSRFAVASLAANSENSEAAIEVFDKGVAACGVPQRLLTDNGTALNPTRRKIRGALVDHVKRLGVEPITGKPYKPTTQGKSERLHRTLFRYLDAQPLARTLDELQGFVDAFDQIYNTERPHQSLPGRITPAQAWAATPTAEPPRPHTSDEPITPGGPPPPTTTEEDQANKRRRARAKIGDTGQTQRRIDINGVVSLAGWGFLVSKTQAHHTITACWDEQNVWFITTNGEVLAHYPWPDPTNRYVTYHDPTTKNTRGGRPPKNT